MKLTKDDEDDGSLHEVSVSKQQETVSILRHRDRESTNEAAWMDVHVGEDQAVRVFLKISTQNMMNKGSPR